MRFYGAVGLSEARAIAVREQVRRRVPNCLVRRGHY